MANKTIANMTGLNQDYSGQSGIWNLSEVVERSQITNERQWGGLIAPFTVDYLVIGGGGGGGVGMTGSSYSTGGGGAGGYLNSFGSENSGGNTSGLSSLTLEANEDYSVTIGAGGAADADGSNTVFSGTDSSDTAFNKTANGGGHGGGGTTTSTIVGANGGSGGGGGSKGFSTNKATGAGGTGTTNQGTNGAAGTANTQVDAFLCEATGEEQYCNNDDAKGGGGGGAQTAGATSGNGGNGLASSITGSSVTRAGGGKAANDSNGGSPSRGSGSTNSGGGGDGGTSSTATAGQDGVVILHYPNARTLTASGLTVSTTDNGTYKISTITAGSGTFQFS